MPVKALSRKGKAKQSGNAKNIASVSKKDTEAFLFPLPMEKYFLGEKRLKDK